MWSLFQVSDPNHPLEHMYVLALICIVRQSLHYNLQRKKTDLFQYLKNNDCYNIDWNWYLHNQRKIEIKKMN
jgi:hypothetical protein